MPRRGNRFVIPDDVREIRRRHAICLNAGLSGQEAARIASDLDEALPDAPVSAPTEQPQDFKPPFVGPKDEDGKPALPKAYAALDLLGPDWETMKSQELMKIAEQVSPRKINSRSQAVNAIQSALAERAGAT